ncbi:MAG: choice-of-anchor Q domain-containing protein [Flavobacteriales bacterium]
MIKSFFGLSVLFFLAASLFFLPSSCKKDEVFSGADAKLSYSIDTLVFDTTFTGLGSVTKRIKIYNHEDEKVSIDRIFVENYIDNFKINVDGQFVDLAENIEIYPGDSIFIFLEATINTNASLPFILEDDLIIETNGKIDKIHLVAWGQDAHYWYKETADTFFTQDGDTLLLSQIRVDEDRTIDSDLPHVIYSNIVVRNGATLTINPGARLHLYHRVNIIVHDGGKLVVNGNGFEDQRVIITGHRIDADYKHRAGQWGILQICQDAGPCSIKNAEIRNGTIGCYLGGPFVGEAFDATPTPELVIENSIITNMSDYGVLAQSAKASITNSELSDCGELLFFAYIGGDYTLKHNTLGNYFSGRNSISMALTNHLTDELNAEFHYKDLNFLMENSILYGSFQSELAFSKSNQSSFDVQFRNSLLKAKSKDDLDIDDEVVFQNCLFNENPLFLKTYENRQSNYRLDSLSAAINEANPTISTEFPLDLDGQSRLNDGEPDLGAYEYVD